LLVYRLACNAQASFKCRHESADGGDLGRLSDSVGLLRFVDFVATRDSVERDCGIDQFLKRRRIPPLRPHRKSQASRLTQIFSTESRSALPREKVRYLSVEA